MRLKILVIFTLSLPLLVFAQSEKKSPEVNVAIDSVAKFMDIGNFSAAEKWLKMAEAAMPEEPFQKDYFRYKYNEGMLYLKRWEFETAEPVLMECLRIARAASDSTQLTMAYAVLSQLKAEQSLYGASIVYGKEALGYLNSNDSSVYYGLTSNLSISHMHERNTETSLKYALSAKRYYERVHMFQEIALVENNIGELYREQFRDNDMAEKHYRRAVKINKSQGFKGGLASNYLNLALAFNNKNQEDSSLHYIKLARKLRLEMGDVGGLAIVFNALGTIQLQQGNTERAKKAFSETVAISKENNIFPGLYYGNIGLGDAYFTDGINNLAKEYYEKALETAIDLDSKTFIADIHNKLYEVERDNQNFETALHHFELFSTYSDSIRMKTKENEFAELKTKYETDLATAENQLLKATQASQKAELSRQKLTTFGLWMLLGFVLAITVILYIGYNRRSESLRKEAVLRKELEAQYKTVQTQKEELRKLDELKNKIFAVLGHDLRGPLTSISSLVSLINSKDLKPEEFTEVTQHLDNETKAGLTSLQNILEWSQIKAGMEKTQIEELAVAPIINEFLRSYHRQIAEKKLNISTNWDDATTIYADKNQFKSIAINLISNAIKFSPKGGEIVVRTRKDTKGVHFMVCDSGDGISKELIARLNSNEKIMSHRGTNGEKGTGIGLRIAKDFAELHGGSLVFEHTKNGGTKVDVFFPNRAQVFKVSA